MHHHWHYWPKPLRRRYFSRRLWDSTCDACDLGSGAGDGEGACFDARGHCEGSRVGGIGDTEGDGLGCRSRNDEGGWRAIDGEIGCDAMRESEGGRDYSDG